MFEQRGHFAVKEAVDHGDHEALDVLDETVEEVVDLGPGRRVAHDVRTEHEVKAEEWDLIKIESLFEFVLKNAVFFMHLPRMRVAFTARRY
jgi:hypothetical protein